VRKDKIQAAVTIRVEAKEGMGEIRGTSNQIMGGGKKVSGGLCHVEKTQKLLICHKATSAEIRVGKNFPELRLEGEGGCLVGLVNKT